MAKKVRKCVECNKRPRWKYKNNPGNMYCKRCYHELWKRGDFVHSPFQTQEDEADFPSFSDNTVWLDD